MSKRGVELVSGSSVGTQAKTYVYFKRRKLKEKQSHEQILFRYARDLGVVWSPSAKLQEHRYVFIR